MRPKVDLIYIDSGGGHRAAANALRETIQERGLPWDLRTFSMQDLLDPIDFIKKYTGIACQDVYNIMLRRGWTAGSAQMIRVMHLAIRMFHRRQVGVLAHYWKERRPNLVVSLIPHFNRAIKDSLDLVQPETPLVTILTDIADYPPHFWIERQDQHVICGSHFAAIQARFLGVPGHKVHEVSGMIVHPRFYRPVNPDRRQERVRLGLQPDLPTGLVLFGGEGSREMVEVARNLNRPGSGVQLILLCGKHEQVKSELLSLSPEIPMFVEGFTREMPFFMELADFFIGKPGPGSISEAVAKQLPIIVRCDRKTLAHEEFNCDWIQKNGLGIVVKSYRGLFDAVRELIEPDCYGRFKQRLSEMRNRAVFEIPELLEQILLAEVKDLAVDLREPAAP